MIPIQELLKRFKNLTNTDKVKKEVVAEVILKNNIPITINQILFSKKTIIIKTNPIVKTEILLKKEEILKQVQTALGNDIFSEIR